MYLYLIIMYYKVYYAYRFRHICSITFYILCLHIDWFQDCMCLCVSCWIVGYNYYTKQRFDFFNQCFKSLKWLFCLESRLSATESNMVFACLLKGKTHHEQGQSTCILHSYWSPLTEQLHFELTTAALQQVCVYTYFYFTSVSNTF